MASKAIGFLNFKFGADLGGFERAMNKTQKKLKKFGKSVTKVGKNLSRNLTLPIVGIGIASAKMSMDFDKSMTKVITLVGIAEDKVNSMRKSVLELSDITGIAAVEMAEGLFFLTSAGLRGANALETLEMVGKATASGLGDMESLSKVAAAAQNAYGVETLTAADALDTFGGMVKSGMFEANELSKVLGGQMGLAATLGISMEELGAFIATYTKTTGDATSATTGLEGVMMSFAKITPKQERALSKINITVEQLRTSLSEQGLQKTLIMMASKFKAAGVDLSEFFSKSSALKGVLGVLGNQTETYIGILDDLTSAQGFVDDAFDRTSKMAGFQMTKSFNQLKNAGIEMGDALAPIIIMISEKIQKLAEWFRELSESQKKNIVMWGLILAAIGPVLIIFGTLSIAIGAVMSPLGLAAVAVGALGAAFIYLSTSASDVATSVRTSFSTMIDSLIAGVNTAKRTFKLLGLYAMTGSNSKPIETGLSRGNKFRGGGSNLKNFDKPTEPTEEVVVDIKENIKKLEEPLSKVEDQFKGLVTWKNDFFKAGKSPVEDQFKGILTWTQKLTEAQKAHNASIVLMKDIMFSAAMSAANSQENFFKGFIENLKQAIKQLLIQLAIMTVITFLLGGPTMTIAKAFGAAKLSVLGLADGGLVTGPTTALIGEGVGTTASNPEVVAPLDKLKSMMGTGEQNIIVEGVLKGNDIYLSNRNTEVNRLRTT